MARRTLARILSHAGFDVAVAADGGEAIAALRGEPIDAVISDVCMPGTGGIELLRFVRIFEPDLPVILITGSPAVESVVEALDHGAWKYLLKPVANEVLIDHARRAAQLTRMTRARRQARASHEPHDEPDLRGAFDAALSSLWMAFQPIVKAEDGSVHGYEAIMRVQHDRFSDPDAMLDAAERLGALSALGETTRRLAAEPVHEAPERGLLFVNLHPAELLDDVLLDETTTLGQMAWRVVLEVTERRAIEEAEPIRRRIEELRELGYRIALDHLGAGYAGLTSFALLEPDVVKIDWALVRDIDESKLKRRIVRSITTLCSDMEIEVVAEGVETGAERDVLADLGCDLLQGHLFAKPGEPFPRVSL